MSVVLKSSYLNLPSSPRPVIAMDEDWKDGDVSGWHTHPRGQLLFAIEGVMLVHIHNGSWIVPPNRALWIIEGQEHHVTMFGNVKIRTVYIDEKKIKKLPSKTCVLNVSSLLRELIVSAVKVPLDYAPGSRHDHLVRLLIDELRDADELPFYLPIPKDPRIAVICNGLIANPADTASVSDWSKVINVSTKTIHRMFTKHTGMTFVQWREQARLMVALRRISIGEKIINVALDCGYGSHSAFTAMFKRHFGAPPSEYHQTTIQKDLSGNTKSPPLQHKNM
jgi:AraC-like DNA-binding protein